LFFFCFLFLCFSVLFLTDPGNEPGNRRRNRACAPEHKARRGRNAACSKMQTGAATREGSGDGKRGGAAVMPTRDADGNRRRTRLGTETHCTGQQRKKDNRTHDGGRRNYGG
jgi:hypothetical protein